jgi:hypothetical protein
MLLQKNQAIIKVKLYDETGRLIDKIRAKKTDVPQLVKNWCNAK